jgi:hypothetical protein
VRWDEYAIPHVHAANEHDLFMPKVICTPRKDSGKWNSTDAFSPAAWRKSSVILPFHGKSYQRTFAVAVASTSITSFVCSASALPPPLRLRTCRSPEQLRLRDYSLGVNAYIEQCGKKLPWEFRLLRHIPEPWRPEDSLTIAKGFAFLLLHRALHSAQLDRDCRQTRRPAGNAPFADAQLSRRCADEYSRGLAAGERHVAIHQWRSSGK